MRATVLALLLLGCGGPKPVAPKSSGPPLETASLTAIAQGPGARWAIVGAPRALFSGPMAAYVNKLIPKEGMDKLQAHGVGHDFGIPGDYVLGLYDQLLKSGLQTILTRDEQGAGFAADGYARVHGLGVVCITY